MNQGDPLSVDFPHLVIALHCHLDTVRTFVDDNEDLARVAHERACAIAAELSLDQERCRWTS